MRLIATALFLAACSTPTEPPTTTTQVATAPTPADGTATQPLTADASSHRVNLNTATPEQLKAAVPEISDRMVHEFEEYRPYISIAQFRREMSKYVEAEVIATYENYVFVPVDSNNSDAATLQQLPGVTPEVAAKLTEARPYASPQAFITVLTDNGLPQAAATATAWDVQ